MGNPIAEVNTQIGDPCATYQCRLSQRDAVEISSLFVLAVLAEDAGFS